jgi:hypothetical protein
MTTKKGVNNFGVFWPRAILPGKCVAFVRIGGGLGL